MNINYIILAHKNPPQVKRLVERLSKKWTYFYIHIDANIDIIPFKKEMKEFGNIHFLDETEREDTIWGDIGLVKATLNLMSRIVMDNRYGYCVLLSGQDYPLQTNHSIQEFLIRNHDINFIEVFPVQTGWKKNGIDRINKYKIKKSRKRGHFLLLSSIFDKEFYSLQTLGKVNFLLKTGKYKEIALILKNRKFPNFLKSYGGSQWWALPIGTVKKILNFVEDNPNYLQYHRYTLIPDEIFFHSILMHLKSKEYLPIAPSLTYTNWTRPSGPLPVTFSKRDFAELKNIPSEKLFARKFGIEIDESILDKIDDELLQ